MIRRDLAVVMARGQSRRMGQDKGLVRLTADGPALVRVVADLYRSLAIPVLIVTLEDRAPDYMDALADASGVRVVTGGPGGDTARTLVLARKALEGEPVTHFWAHPVDLPAVTPETLGQLLEESGRHPDEVVRPAWQGKPGHPVALPAGLIADVELLTGWREKPLRELLADRFSPGGRTVSVNDRGVVLDFDRPGDLPPGSPSSPKRGAS